MNTGNFTLKPGLHSSATSHFSPNNTPRQRIREGEEAKTLVIPVYYLLANLICSEQKEIPLKKRERRHKPKFRQLRSICNPHVTSSFSRLFYCLSLVLCQWMFKDPWMFFSSLLCLLTIRFHYFFSQSLDDQCLWIWNTWCVYTPVGIH